MAKVLRSIDIGEFPEVVRLVEEMLLSGEPVVLQYLGRDLAVLEPMSDEIAERGRKILTPEERAAFESSAGAWKDIEGVDEMVRYIKSLRGRPDESSDEP